MNEIHPAWVLRWRAGQDYYWTGTHWDTRPWMARLFKSADDANRARTKMFLHQKIAVVAAHQVNLIDPGAIDYACHPDPELDPPS